MTMEECFPLTALPPEVFISVLSFLKGKSLSSLWLAYGGHIEPQHLIEQTTRNHLLTSTLEITGHESTVQWIHSVLHAPQSLSKSLRFSMIAALLDYLHLCKTKFAWGGDCCYFENPVWVGTIILALSSGRRIRASIVITTPLQLPCCWIPGSSLVSHHRTPTALFRREMMRITPVPPWGRLHEISTTESSLKEMAHELQGNVAIPSGFVTDALDIRIMTATEARQRLASSTFLRDRYASHPNIQGHEDCRLVCCWQDDRTEEPNFVASVDYLIALMNAYERLQHTTL